MFQTDQNSKYLNREISNFLTHRFGSQFHFPRLKMPTYYQLPSTYRKVSCMVSTGPFDVTHSGADSWHTRTWKGKDVADHL